MLIHTRKLLLGLVLGGACATTASAQELLIPASGSIPVPPPIAGVEESIPATPAPTSTPYTASTPYTTQIVETTPPAPSGVIMTPIPDDGTVTIRVSDCPQGGVGGGSDSSRRCQPPTTGWVAPGRVPVYRTWVPYWKFYPTKWTGQPAVPQVRLPVIYTPTDTTQLGYYYQHVPTWHSYANMIPPVPRPVDWHHSYQPTRVVGGMRVVAPTETLGEPQAIPTPAEDQSAPPPPTQSLDKSAAAPELLPLMR